MNKIILNENQLNRLFEYHAQQRLPFEEVFYGKKNQAEQYLDWLEEFGKYGKIGDRFIYMYNDEGNLIKIDLDDISYFEEVYDEGIY